MRFPKKFLTISLVAVVAFTATPLTSAGAGEVIPGRWTSPSKGCWDTKPSERGFAQKINVARSSSSRSRLRLDSQLSRSARKHTWEMVRANSLHHTPDATLRRRVTNWRVLGENVGVGGTVDSLHRAFMASPLHRDNVLYSTFRHVGVGVVRKNDRMWVTVLFEAQTDPGTTLRMPACA